MIAVLMTNSGEWLFFDADSATICAGEGRPLVLRKASSICGMIAEGEWLCWKLADSISIGDTVAYLSSMPRIKPHDIRSRTIGDDDIDS